MASSRGNEYLTPDLAFLHWKDTNQFKGLPLETFQGALFVGDSLWICGWNKNITGQKSIVFLNVESDDYDVLSKHQLKYHGADKPIIMFAAREKIFFSKRNGNTIYVFNTTTHEFYQVFHGNYVNISAMCGKEDNVYILDKNQSRSIQILDQTFHVSGRTATGLGSIHDCDVYMYSVDDTIAISTSYPLGSIRLLEWNHGVLWQVNIRNSPTVPMRFNPCSVSVTSDGRIFFADRFAHEVCITCIIDKEMQ